MFIRYFRVIFATVMALVILSPAFALAGAEEGSLGAGDTGAEKGVGAEIEERIRERREEIAKLRDSPGLADERREKPLEERVYVRGKVVDFEEYGQPPLLKDGRTLVPLRTISDSLGAEVMWESKTKKVTVTHEENIIELVIGEKEVKVNGEIREVDVGGKITGKNRTVVPLRFISEIMGESVDYWEETREIDVGLDGLEEVDSEPVGEKSPVEVVNNFWSLYSEGRYSEAQNKVIGEDDLGIGEMVVNDEIAKGLDEQEKAVLDRFRIEAFGYETDSEVSLVDIELEKPDIAAAIDKYYEKAINMEEDLVEQGLTQEEAWEKIEKEVDDILLEAIKFVETITYQEQVELHLIENEWKIYKWHLDSMEKRWDELREDYF